MTFEVWGLFLGDIARLLNMGVLRCNIFLNGGVDLETAGIKRPNACA